MKIEVKLPKLPGLSEVEQLAEAVRVNVAELVMEEVRENFLRRGGKSFWRAAADATNVSGEGKRMLVSVKARGVALRYYGGSVRARTPRKLLALPAAPGMTEYARSVPGLVMVPLRGYPHLRGLLVKSEPHEAARKYKERPAGRTSQRVVIGADGKMDVRYTLVDETQHKADPTVLPTDAALAGTAERGAAEALQFFKDL